MSNYHSYNEPTPCPYCGYPCHADFVDVAVGMVQCGPYHCEKCRASEIGPYDEKRELTSEEKRTGWYAPESEPGSSANVINGKIVTHGQALQAYRDLYPLSATNTGRKLIRNSDPYKEPNDGQ